MGTDYSNDLPTICKERSIVRVAGANFILRCSGGEEEDCCQSFFFAGVVYNKTENPPNSTNVR